MVHANGIKKVLEKKSRKILLSAKLCQFFEVSIYKIFNCKDFFMPDCFNIKHWFEILLANVFD